MGDWEEWEGRGIDGHFVFVNQQWLEDTSTERALLAHALRSIGVTSSPNNAHTMAGQAEFQWGWFGYVDGDLDPETCDEHGFTPEGHSVDTARKCTFAVLVGQHASL